MATKVKTFTVALKIFQVAGELESLDKAVDDFIDSNDVKRVISVSDTCTTGENGETIGLIRVLAYE